MTLLLPLFQTICYNRLPLLKNEDGLVSLQFKKKDSQLIAEQEVIRTTLQNIVNNPSVTVVVESIRPLPDDWYAPIIVISITYHYSYNCMISILHSR